MVVPLCSSTTHHSGRRPQRYQVCSVQQNLRSLATSVPREGATGLNVVAASSRKLGIALPCHPHVWTPTPPGLGRTGAHACRGESYGFRAAQRTPNVTPAWEVTYSNEKFRNGKFRNLLDLLARVVVNERACFLEPTTPALGDQEIQAAKSAAIVHTHTRAVWQRDAGCDHAHNDTERHARASSRAGAHTRAAAAASSPA